MNETDNARPAPSRLLTFPAEIRQLILNHLLIRNTEISPNVEVVDERKAVQLHVPQHYWDLALRLAYAAFPPETTLAVARTCKKLYNEALFIYYGFNVFRFRDICHLGQYLHGIGLERRLCLKSLDFVYDAGMEDRGYQDPLKAIELLVQCANLRELKVRIDTWGMRPPIDPFRLAGLQKLREIRGCKKVDVLAFCPGGQSIAQNAFLRDFKYVAEQELCWAKGQTRLRYVRGVP